MPPVFQDLDMFIVLILLNTQEVLRFLFASSFALFSESTVVGVFFFFFTVSSLFKDIGEVAYNRGIIVTQGCISPLAYSQNTNGKKLKAS